jgi:sugar phosphate isomerase/epimerase
MTRAVTLFTGQWADLPLETVAQKAREFGFDGLELACWGDHFDVVRALAEDGYCQARRDLLAKHGLEWEIGPLAGEQRDGSRHVGGVCVDGEVKD